MSEKEGYGDINKMINRTFTMAATFQRRQHTPPTPVPVLFGTCICSNAASSPYKFGDVSELRLIF